MKKTAFVFIMAVLHLAAYGQVADAEKQLKTISEDSIMGWHKEE